MGELERPIINALSSALCSVNPVSPVVLSTQVNAITPLFAPFPPLEATATRFEGGSGTEASSVVTLATLDHRDSPSAPTALMRYQYVVFLGRPVCANVVRLTPTSKADGLVNVLFVALSRTNLVSFVVLSFQVSVTTPLLSPYPPLAVLANNVVGAGYLFALSGTLILIAGESAVAPSKVLVTVNTRKTSVTTVGNVIIPLAAMIPVGKPDFSTYVNPAGSTGMLMVVDVRVGSITEMELATVAAV